MGRQEHFDDEDNVNSDYSSDDIENDNQINANKKSKRNESSILKSSQSLRRNRRQNHYRRPTITEGLSVVRLLDANIAEYSSCVIQAVKFHPFASLIATAGLDKTIRLYQVCSFNMIN